MSASSSLIGMVTQWHNETFNVLSHLLPSVFLFSYAMSQEWRDPGTGKAVPERVILIFFALQCSATFACSGVYHMFMSACDSQWTYDALLKTDVIGVAMSITGGLLLEVWMPLACISGELKAAVIMGLFLLVSAGICVSTNVKQRGMVLFPLLLVLLAGLVLRMNSPMRVEGWYGWYLWGRGTMMVMAGGFVNAFRAPERWIGAGPLDYFGNSHNIMHVMVVVATYFSIRAALDDVEHSAQRAPELHACALEQWPMTWLQ